ncbi:uncharacterized threonine-rich GPI-anchored glycoprotein PJ4664.02 isoform X3 [Xiphophorus hellerii]|nr:uncharacterized threonine-rich GPI-anchored glycoprotein PJ4664.02-like isoform X3 [Xiphophorus hellerii]
MTTQHETTIAPTTAMGNNTTIHTTAAPTTATGNNTTAHTAQATVITATNSNMTTQVQITVSNNNTTAAVSTTMSGINTTSVDLTTVTNNNVTTMVTITPTSAAMTTNASIGPTVNHTTASTTNTPLDNNTAMTTTNNHTTENVPTTTNGNTAGTFVTVTNNATATTSNNVTVSPQITSITHFPTTDTSNNHTATTSVTEMGKTTTLITSTPHSSNMTTTMNSATTEQANTTLASSAGTSETPASTAIPFTSTDTKNITDSSPTSTPPPTSNFPGSSNTPSTGNATTLSSSPTTSAESSVTMGETTTTPPLPTNSPSDATETLNTNTPTSTGGATEIFTTFRTTGGITSSSPTKAPTTPSPVIVCPSVPCPVESVCLNRTCQCLSGNYLLNGRCVPAQVFPGRLHFQLLTFEDQMRDRSSRIFQETAAKISAALRDVLKSQPGYRRSEIVQLEPGSVIASVNNIFEDSPATQESVDQIIEKAVKNPQGPLSNATYTGTNLCQVEPLPCDVSSTKCTNVNGQASCACKDGYISMIYSKTSCKACPSGQQAVRDKCVTCPFGYAGFNCNDSSLLAVVVISCVLGGVLLILVLALLGYCCWKRCSRTNPDHNISPYSDELNKSWPAGITPIPRATTHWEPAGSIEMTEGGSTNTLADKKLESNGFGSQLKQKRWKKSGSYDLNPEEMKTFKGKNTSRYSYLVEGHENPYFLPGDEKRNSTKK